MNYGMTYKEFWYGDPWMVRAYAQAYLLKRKIDNETAWIQGAYVFAALNASLATAFGKKREKYLQEPVDFFPKTEMEKELERREKRRKVIEYLDRLVKKK